MEKRRKDEDKTIKITHHNGEEDERTRRHVRMNDVSEFKCCTISNYLNNIFNRTSTFARNATKKHTTRSHVQVEVPTTRSSPQHFNNASELIIKFTLLSQFSVEFDIILRGTN